MFEVQLKTGEAQGLFSKDDRDAVSLTFIFIFIHTFIISFCFFLSLLFQEKKIPKLEFTSS